ncbi:hypothetical protein BDZ89DRAFT_279416 [Hymenopellis radicata]|nr:hypothetical protein BDZ89DRAFT_279416 [Hymenopellis radicata]
MERTAGSDVTALTTPTKAKVDSRDATLRLVRKRAFTRTISCLAHARLDGGTGRRRGRRAAFALLLLHSALPLFLSTWLRAPHSTRVCLGGIDYETLNMLIVSPHQFRWPSRSRCDNCMTMGARLFWQRMMLSSRSMWTSLIALTLYQSPHWREAPNDAILLALESRLPRITSRRRCSWIWQIARMGVWAHRHQYLGQDTCTAVLFLHTRN